MEDSGRQFHVICSVRFGLLDCDRGVIYLAHLMHVPQTWIIGIAVVLLGIGIVTGVQNTRGKDPN